MLKNLSNNLLEIKGNKLSFGMILQWKAQEVLVYSSLFNYLTLAWFDESTTVLYRNNSCNNCKLITV